MSDTTRLLRFVPALEEPTIRRIVGVFVTLVGLLVILGLMAVLPGIERLVSALAIPPLALGLALVTLLTVSALLWVAPTVEREVEQSLNGPTAAVTNAAVSAKLLVVFAAVVLAYHGFAAAVTSLFAAFGITGFYHLGFLLLGLLVLGAFARRFARCWAPVTELVTAHVTAAFGGTSRTGMSSDR